MKRPSRRAKKVKSWGVLHPGSFVSEQEVQAILFWLSWYLQEISVIVILTIIHFIHRIVQFKKHLNRNKSSHSFERNEITIYSLHEIMCDKKAKCGSMGMIHNQKPSEGTAVSLYWVLPQLKRVLNYACIDRQFKDVCYQSKTYLQNLVEAQITEFKTAKSKSLDNLGRD